MCVVHIKYAVNVHILYIIFYICICYFLSFGVALRHKQGMYMCFYPCLQHDAQLTFSSCLSRNGKACNNVWSSGHFRWGGQISTRVALSQVEVLYLVMAVREDK